MFSVEPLDSKSWIHAVPDFNLEEEQREEERRGGQQHLSRETQIEEMCLTRAEREDGGDTSRGQNYI